MRAPTVVTSRILLVLSLFLILAAGRAEGQPDPATLTSYPCSHAATWIWNYPGDGVGNVKGRVRFPTASCNSADGPPLVIPAVIFVHGNGMDWLDHDDLMIHLTRNGFVTVSIDNTASSNEDRAMLLISFLNSLHTFWGWKDRLSNDVAFAGHSRGGEAAVVAARLLADDPSLGAEAYDVEAVISIAPTDGGMTDNEPHESLTGETADGYLAIYGSHDEDVAGSPSATGSPEPHRTAFALYDRAGSEGSNEGFVIAGTHLDKAFVFIHGMTHRAFLDDADEFGEIGGSPDGRNVAKAYFNAFLRWKVLGSLSYRDFFDGTLRPDSLEDLELFQQFSAGARRVVDNFEDADLDENTLGGSVTKSNSGILTFLDGDLHDIVNSSPHDSRGLRVTWVDTSWVRWIVPNEAPFGVGPLRDVSDYDFLSFRVAQVYNNTYNTEGQDQDFHVRLYTGAGLSNKVPVSLHGRIPYPDEFLCPSAECGAPPAVDHSKSAMTTVRIPLSAFDNVDLTDVRYIYLYFDVPGRSTGAITLDSLEFVH